MGEGEVGYLIILGFKIEMLQFRFFFFKLIPKRCSFGTDIKINARLKTRHFGIKLKLYKKSPNVLNPTSLALTFSSVVLPPSLPLSNQLSGIFFFFFFEQLSCIISTKTQQITHMLNYSIYIYTQCGAVSRRSVKQLPIAALAVVDMPESPPTTALDTYGGALQRSDRFDAGQLHQCQSNPNRASLNPKSIDVLV